MKWLAISKSTGYWISRVETHAGISTPSRVACITQRSPSRAIRCVELIDRHADAVQWHRQVLTRRVEPRIDNEASTVKLYAEEHVRPRRLRERL